METNLEIALARQAFEEATMFLAATAAADAAARQIIVLANKGVKLTEDTAKSLATNELIAISDGFGNVQDRDDAAWEYARKYFYLRLYKRIDAAVQARIALPDPSDD